MIINSNIYEDKFPLISVGVTVFKSLYLDRLLLKLIEQDYPNLEFIFSIDNPSEEIIFKLKKFKEKRGSTKLFINTPPLGPINNYKSCLKLATGKYFLRIDDDDEPLNENYIKELYNKIYTGYDFVIPNVNTINEKNLPIRQNINFVYKNCNNKLDFCVAFFTESAMIFYSLFDRDKLISLKYKLSGKHYSEGIQNFETLINLNGTYSSNTTLLYRIHTESVSTNGKPLDYIVDYNRYSIFIFILIFKSKFKFFKKIKLYKLLVFNYVKVLTYLFKSFLNNIFKRLLFLTN